MGMQSRQQQQELQRKREIEALKMQQLQQQMAAAKQEQEDQNALAERLGQVDESGLMGALARVDPKAAISLATGQGNQMPSNVREWQYFSQLPQEQQEQYLRMRRGSSPMDLGGYVAIPSQVDPRQPVATFNKTLPPQETPQVKGEQRRATEQAAVDVETPKLRRAAQGALNQLERQNKVVTTHIDKALNLISPWSTGYGSFLSLLPNTDARALENELRTIKANIGFDKLQEMRNNSPTGGALGQVSEMENRLLQAVNGALDPAQSEQLAENLRAIKELYPQVLQERREAFQQDFGGGQPQRKEKTEDPLGIR